MPRTITLPVETGNHIFTCLFDQPLVLDAAETSVLGDLALFTTGEHFISRLEPSVMTRMRLSLTCRYFRDILRSPRNRLTIIEHDEDGSIKTIWKQPGYSTWETERLEFWTHNDTSGPVVPFVVPSEDWPYVKGVVELFDVSPTEKFSLRPGSHTRPRTKSAIALVQAADRTHRN